MFWVGVPCLLDVSKCGVLSGSNTGISSWNCLKRKLRSNRFLVASDQSGATKFRQSASLRGNLSCETLKEMRYTVYISPKRKSSKKTCKISKGETMEQQLLHCVIAVAFGGFAIAATQGTPWTSPVFSPMADVAEPMEVGRCTAWKSRWDGFLSVFLGKLGCF